MPFPIHNGRHMSALGCALGATRIAGAVHTSPRGGAVASLGAKRVPARVANARADDSMGPPNSYRAATGH